MHCGHSLWLYNCNYFFILSWNKMDNLVKRIVQKELENQGEPSEKNKKQADFRLGKLLEKIRGKEEPTSNTIKKEKRVYIKWKRRDPIKQMDTTVSLKNGEGTGFFYVVRKIQLFPLNRRRLNYTFRMVKTSMVKKHKTVQSIFKMHQEC